MYLSNCVFKKLHHKQIAGYEIICILETETKGIRLYNIKIFMDNDRIVL